MSEKEKAYARWQITLILNVSLKWKINRHKNAVAFLLLLPNYHALVFKNPPHLRSQGWY